MSVSIVSFLETSDNYKVWKYVENNFASLNTNISDQELDDIALVLNTNGIGLFGTRKLKGVYFWNGTTWEYANQELQDQAQSNLTAILSNDQDITNLENDKTDNGGYTGTAQDIVDLIPDVNGFVPSGNYIGTGEDLKNDIDRLTWSAFIKSELPLMNQQARPNYEPYFGVRETIVNVDNTGTWKLLLPYDGDYEIELDYRFSLNTTTTNFEAHLLLDGSLFSMPLHIEPKDSAGTGEVVPLVVNDQLSGGTANTGTDQFIKASGKRFINRNAGDEIDLRLEFAGQLANQEATIYNASLIVRYVENKNVFTVPPSIGTATISYNPFFGGFNSTVTINNTSGSVINSWSVIVSGTNWDLTNDFGQCIATDLGNGNWMIENESFNGTIQDGGSINFSFQGTTGNTNGVQSPTNGQITVSGS